MRTRSSLPLLLILLMLTSFLQPMLFNSPSTSIEDESEQVGITDLLRSTTTGQVEMNQAQERAFSQTSFGRSANSTWSASGGSEDRDFIYEMVEDSQGNIIVAGSVFVDCWLGSIIVRTEGLGDIIVAKLDTSGNWLWAKTAGTAIAYDEARGVAIDADDDIYITGYLNGTVDFGNTTLTSIKFDGYIAKLNGSNGNWIYAEKYGGFDVDVGWDIVVDSDEDVYVTGFYQNFTNFGGYNLNGGSPSEDSRFFVAKYNHSTPDWEWAYTGIGDAVSTGFQLVLDAAEDVYVVGYNTGSVTWNNNFTSSTTGTWNGVVLKYSHEGVFQWGRSVGSSSACFGSNCGVYFNNVVIDSQQRVVVGGNQLGDVTYATKTYTGIGNWDVVVARWQFDGIHDWYAMAGSNGDDRVQALAINPEDKPVVGGWIAGSVAFGSTILSNVSGDSDFFIAQLTRSGQWEWALSMGGAGDDTTHALHGLSDGSYVAGGYFSGTIDFDGIARSATDEDIWVWRFQWDSDGDGIHDFTDNCDKIANANQSNHDGDDEGDACETDDDDDGKHDAIDDCQYGVIGWNSSDTLMDHDSDGCRDDIEDSDDDSDGVMDDVDDCPKGEVGWTANASTDADGDGCRDETEDLDDDSDSIPDVDDNCPSISNNGQEDWDSDGFGNVCDVDDDNDGVDDSSDDCPLNETGWQSNSQTDNDGDGCKDDVEDSDDDNDGMLDVDDDCPSGVTGWIAGPSNDHDGDGCQNDSEDSDNDDDGLINEFDSCPTGELGWIRDGTTDIDNDGCRDAGEDADDDEDGYMDVEDDCPTVSGKAFLGGLRGCPDFDEDGWGDTADAFPQDDTQWEDGDQDGYGDNPTGNNADACPLVSGISLLDRLGCLDSDEDGWSDPDEDWTTEDGADALPFEPTQYVDADKDGFGDDPFGVNGDMCPGYTGYSSEDRAGCPDTDGDGYSDPGAFGGLVWEQADGADHFPSIASQWNDSDGDGFGDNWGNELWNDSRDSSWPGIWIDSAQKVDECPLDAGFAGEHQGCPEGMVGYEPPEENETGGLTTTTSSGGDDTILYIAGGVGGVIVLALLGAVMVLLRKPAPPPPRRKQTPRGSAGSPSPEHVPEIETNQNEMDAVLGWEHVPGWEQLPGGGEYLPVDEHGTNWYRATDGNSWYQNADGSWTIYRQ